MVGSLKHLRNGRNIISNILIAGIVFDDYLRKKTYREIPKVKT